MYLILKRQLKQNELFLIYEFTFLPKISIKKIKKEYNIQVI